MIFLNGITKFKQKIFIKTNGLLRFKGALKNKCGERQGVQGFPLIFIMQKSTSINYVITICRA